MNSEISIRQISQGMWLVRWHHDNGEGIEMIEVTFNNFHEAAAFVEARFI